MTRYLFKRLLIFIPTIVIISLLSFGLSKMAPGDPVELISRGGPAGLEGQESDLLYAEKLYQETAAQLGLDKPPFYLSLSSIAYPDTLYRILQPERRRVLRNLTAQYGHWHAISRYYQSIRPLDLHLAGLPDTLAPQAVNSMRRSLRQLYLSYEDRQISNLINNLDQQVHSDPHLLEQVGGSVTAFQQRYAQVKEQAQTYRLYIPDIKWYGIDNQYHHWFANFLRGDFGRSYIDSRPVADKMKEALYWTLVINLIVILMAYLISIPLGVLSAMRQNQRFDRITSVVLFILYSLPNFWIATMLVVFFTTPEYGMDFFPSMGLGNLNADASWWERITVRSHHLVLPVFCLVYGSLAFLTRQMRGGMVGVINLDYIRTARAKGLKERQVIWKHAFRNALFPIITLLASVLPAALAGSVAIEWIFNIPGMGNLTVKAILSRDWPIVYTVLMLAALLTMAGILLADLMYALVDPRVSFQKKET